MAALKIIGAMGTVLTFAAVYALIENALDAPQDFGKLAIFLVTAMAIGLALWSTSPER